MVKSLKENEQRAKGELRGWREPTLGELGLLFCQLGRIFCLTSFDFVFVA